jgi:hypothetical protein
MTNLKKLEKSKGALLFAFNTDTVDYVKIAERASRLIEQTLRIPTTIISNNPTPLNKNTRVGELKAGTQWFNNDRYTAYQSSPYDTTILLDSDYLMLDNSLEKIMETVEDYAIMLNNQEFDGPKNCRNSDLQQEGVWATAIVFNKTPKSKMLFDLVGRIQRNYTYYCRLHHMQSSTFRNDYAFAIADIMLNGYSRGPGIPWTMLTAPGVLKGLEIKDNKIIVRKDTESYVIPRQCLHVMDKEYLLSDNYGKFVEAICT